MIAPPVPTETDIKGRLREIDFTETAHKTRTGVFWRHESGVHLLLPTSIDGYYPEWIYDEVLLRAEKIAGRKLNQWLGWLPRPENR